jgi:hypothetical protein
MSEYDSGAAAVFGRIMTSSLEVLPDQAGGPVKDLNMRAGTINLGNEDGIVHVRGDLLCDQNVVVKGTNFVNDINIFRQFNDEFTISYGFAVSDSGRLHLYKHDSRVPNATVIFAFGSGDIDASFTTAPESSSIAKMETIQNKKADSDIKFNAD